jgi:Bacterial NAD-glutamate dehydrogenase
VLRAGLTWRQVAVLRAYASYMHQAGSPYSRSYVASCLVAHASFAELLVALFEVRFDPALGAADSPSRTRQVIELTDGVRASLDEVAALDEDRILRGFFNLISATLRTSYFRTDADPSVLVLKINSRALPALPEPRPYAELFVCSPRTEGVHLRFGPVARGGLRWSDRREDYRTEVLGLVKAQAVKNAVIVPVGAKGGLGSLSCGLRPALRNCAPRWWPATAPSSRACSRSPTTGSTVGSSRPATSFDMTAVTRISWSPRTRAPRPSPISSMRSRSSKASGWGTRSLRVAPSATTTKAMGITARGAWSRSGGTSASCAWIPRSTSSPQSASATCPATCSATECSCRTDPARGGLRSSARLSRPRSCAA